MNLLISQPLQLVVIEYLTTKPYNEVASLIQQMQRLQPAPIIPQNPGGNNREESKEPVLDKTAGV